MDIEFHTNVVGLHFVFAIEDKEVVSVGWDRVRDAIRSASSIEIGLIAFTMASFVRRQRQTKN